MKLIIYGMGQVFQKYKNLIPMKSVEAFVDKNAAEGQELFGIPILSPHDLLHCNFDYVVVFSDKFFYQVQRELSCEYFVPIEKIVSWRTIVKDSTVKMNEIQDYLKEHIKAFHNTEIIEFGLDLMYGIVSPANDIYKSGVIVDGVGRAKFPGERAFYRHVWENLGQSDGTYDLAILKPGMLTSEIIAEMEACRIPDIIVIEKHDFERISTAGTLLEAHFPGRVRKTFLCGSVIFEVVPEQDEEIDCVDYVVTHKKYKIEQNGLYRGLCVGSFRMDNLLSELDGESIAEYNDRINETTGLYWIWKNTTSEYVGLSHYRRLFYNNAFQYDMNCLNKHRVKEILCDMKYDLILSEYKHLDWTIYENINRTVGSELNAAAYSLFLEAIKEKQPDYEEAFEHVMRNNSMYICNMFVTSRKILNEYCSWLFSFYLDVVDKIDVSSVTGYPKRVAGYYSEVFWTVWMLMQTYKVFELPMTDVYALK